MIQSALARVTPASRVRYAVTGIVATGLAIAAAIAMAGGASAADPLQVKIGAGEGTVHSSPFGFSHTLSLAFDPRFLTHWTTM